MNDYDALYQAACSQIDRVAGDRGQWLNWLQSNQVGHWQLLQAIAIQVRKGKEQQFPLPVYEALLQLFLAAHFYCHSLWLMRPEPGADLPSPSAPPEWTN